MLFDPVINSAFETEEDQLARDNLSQILICAHCNKPIKGKYHKSGKNYYDEYCWRFRYVIDPLYIERGSRKVVKELDENEY